MLCKTSLAVGNWVGLRKKLVNDVHHMMLQDLAND